MSQENVDRFLESTEAFNRAFNQGDIEPWLETFHPDAILKLQNADLEGEYSGHDGLRRFLAEFAELFEMFNLDYTDVRDLGDRVLGQGAVRSIGKGSGIESELPVAVVASFRDGLCTHVQDYGEHRDAALQAAGLSE
jgi:ketosteroid isomerase-like protein